VSPTDEPTATSEPDVGEAGEPVRYPEEESNLRFEWGMLFDSVALGLSYIWLLCGVVLVLSLAGLFVALWLASRRNAQEDD
jgi:hypothetical protein